MPSTILVRTPDIGWGKLGSEADTLYRGIIYMVVFTMEAQSASVVFRWLILLLFLLPLINASSYKDNIYKLSSTVLNCVSTCQTGPPLCITMGGGRDGGVGSSYKLCRGGPVKTSTDTDETHGKL